MRGVIYARYSSDNQREESIEGQIRENTAFAKKNGIDIVGTYIDRALSAKTDNRPEFQRMIKDSAKKKFDVVIVWKLDRFSRNRYDSAKYKAMLKKNDVKVVSATESISEGAEGIILESVLEGMAEYYSRNLAREVMKGLREAARDENLRRTLDNFNGFLLDTRTFFDTTGAQLADAGQTARQLRLRLEESLTRVDNFLVELNRVLNALDDHPEQLIRGGREQSRLRQTEP